MQSDQQYYGCGRVMNSYENHVGYDIAANNAVGPTIFPSERNVSSHRLEVEPPEHCVGNYYLYNQGVERSQMMFHPMMPQQYSYPGGYNAYPTTMENSVERWNRNDVEKDVSSHFTEDPDEINALLSLDDEQGWEESEEEEVSTARTNGYDGSSSPDSSCNYSTKSKKVKFSSSRNSHGEGSCNNERKKKKMQKMMNVLRGIVPGGQQLSTSAVLDEAVKYLKGLKVEVEQNGVDDANNHA